MQEHTVSCLYLESIEKHHRGSYIDGVNMEDITQCRLCLGACHIYIQVSVELAQLRVVLGYGAYYKKGCFTAPAVHVMCAATTTHLTAHAP